MPKRKLDNKDSNKLGRTVQRSRHDSGFFSAQDSPTSIDGSDSGALSGDYGTDSSSTLAGLYQESYMAMLKFDVPDLHYGDNYSDDWNTTIKESSNAINTIQSLTSSGGDTNTKTYHQDTQMDLDHGYNETYFVEKCPHDMIIRTAKTSCQLNVDNFPYELVHLLEGSHVTQKFKVELKSGEKTIIWSMADLMHYNGVKTVVQKNESIAVSKIFENSQNKVKQFLARDVSKKRSLAFCNNIIRGMALAEMEERLVQDKPTNELDKKARKKCLNEFTNCSRRDRSSGRKLEIKFFEVHEKLTIDSSYGDIDSYFYDTSIFVFNSNGFLNIFLSSQLNEKMHCFYQGKEEFFIVKNLKGFCRVN